MKTYFYTLNSIQYIKKPTSYFTVFLPLFSTSLLFHTGVYQTLLNDKEFSPILLVSDWPRRHTLQTAFCGIFGVSILNAISYAPHILLMTAEVNESQFPKFSFQFIWHWSHNNTFKRKLLCRIPVFYNSLGSE